MQILRQQLGATAVRIQMVTDGYGSPPIELRHAFREELQFLDQFDCAHGDAERFVRDRSALELQTDLQVEAFNQLIESSQVAREFRDH